MGVGLVGIEHLLVDERLQADIDIGINEGKFLQTDGLGPLPAVIDGAVVKFVVDGLVGG